MPTRIFSGKSKTIYQKKKYNSILYRKTKQRKKKRKSKSNAFIIFFFFVQWRRIWTHWHLNIDTRFFVWFGLYLSASLRTTVVIARLSFSHTFFADTAHRSRVELTDKKKYFSLATTHDYDKMEKFDFFVSISRI